MNIIKVSEKQLDDIFVWRDKNKELVRNFLPYLDSGCIQTDNFSIEFKVVGEINDYITTLKLIIINDVIELKFAIKDGKCILIAERELSDFNKLKQLIQSHNSSQRELRQSMIGIFCAVNAYFFHYRQDVNSISHKEVKKHLVVGRGNKAHYETVKKLNKIYTISGRIHNNKVPVSKQWHIDCWNVVGHIRHYSNGKTVYIAPYKKGKNRNADINTIYKI